MFRPSLIVTVLSAAIVIVTSGAASAYQSAYRLPCLIIYPGKAPIVTNCLAVIKATENS